MSNSSDNPLWHVVSGENVPPPDWVNAPNQRGNRLFTPYEKIIAERDRLEVVFNARMARWANLGPTLTFALLIAIVLFKFDAPGFGVCFALLGVATCAISLWIVRIQERSGSYLIIDLKTRTIAVVLFYCFRSGVTGGGLN